MRAAPYFMCTAQPSRPRSRSRIALTEGRGATRWLTPPSMSGDWISTASVTPILAHQNIGSILLIAHSWGSMPASLFAGEHPALVERLVLFAPIARRDPRRYEQPATFPARRIVILEDQWDRFVEDVPVHETPVLSRLHFDEWGQRYLDSDPDSRSRDPFGVKTPLGPFSEIIKAWHGQLAWDPAKVRAPTAIIRGEWDGLIPDEDARWLFDALAHAPVKRDIKISRGTHLMHLETMHLALWRESVNFLQGEDAAAIPRMVKKLKWLRIRSVIQGRDSGAGGRRIDFLGRSMTPSRTVGVRGPLWIGRASWPMSPGRWTKSCWRETNIWPPKTAS